MPFGAGMGGFPNFGMARNMGMGMGMAGMNMEVVESLGMSSFMGVNAFRNIHPPVQHPFSSYQQHLPFDSFGSLRIQRESNPTWVEPELEFNHAQELGEETIMKPPSTRFSG